MVTPISSLGHYCCYGLKYDAAKTPQQRSKQIVTKFSSGTTNPSLAKEEIDQILGYADSVKKDRVDELIKQHEAKAAVAE